MSRQLIVVDVETTGLNPDVHLPLEVAAINVATNEVLHFVPTLTRANLENVEPAAMEINRYFERGMWRHALTIDETVAAYQTLFSWLEGNTLGGSNPRFDGQMLIRGYGAALSLSLMDFVCKAQAATVREVWHHRLADLSAYAGPALLRAPNELVGLADVCTALGVTNPDEHTALGDAQATADCFRILTSHYAATIEPVVNQ